MGESPRVANVHVVEGRPWKDALIKILAPGCPYRPWHYAKGIEPGDAVVVVLDTDPPSVLNGVGIVGPKGDVGGAIGGMGDDESRGLLDVATMQMLTGVALGTRMGPVHGHRSFDDVVAAIGGRMRAASDARFGHSSLAAARVLLESGGQCAGCHRQLDLDGEDARDRVHVHTADPSGPSSDRRNQGNVTDWPAVLCDLCHDGMQQGGFTSFLDFRFSLNPPCPSCSSQRSRSTMYGMPAFGPVEEPWIAAMGCCVEPWDWRCDVCGHRW